MYNEKTFYVSHTYIKGEIAYFYIAVSMKISTVVYEN